MATTKRKPTTKKVTTKKVKGFKKPAPLTWKFYVVAVGIFLVVVATIVVAGYLTAGVVAKQANKERYDRITAIYDSINLEDQDYLPQRFDIFGDKRVYEWDKGRTFSSAVEYVHGDTVSNTVAELDAKIKEAGFTFVDEPYPGAKQVQYHYKSSKGEYVRLTVESKPYRDAFVNASAMNKEDSPGVYNMDANAGPAYVTLKVNLDDNNE